LTGRAARRTVAGILLSTTTFERHFEQRLGLTRDEYLNEWRSGWVWSYCRMLAGESVSPVVYVASRRHRGLFETPEGYGVRFLPVGAAYAPWDRFPELARSGVGRYLEQAVNYAALRRSLRHAVREDRVDALLVQEYWTARYDLLALDSPVPVVAIDQGFSPDREILLMKRRTLPRSARVITQTGAEAERVSTYGAVAERIPNGVDTTWYSPPPPDEPRVDRTLVSVGQLNDDHKRTSDILRAIAELGPPWRAQLFGSGPDAERLAGLASELGIADRVEFRGFVSDSTVIRDELRSCAVFALPSAREGLPMALLEAMACGAAPVGSDIPAIAEVIEDGISGLLVPVGDPGSLARAIAQAAGRRDAIGAAARERVERSFSERAIAPRLAHAIGRAIAPRQPGGATAS
jgi:glycosyltransferase involved in cell wall biosynthesis